MLLGKEEAEETGECRAEGSSARGKREQAAFPLFPDSDGTHVHISASSQLEGLSVRDLL